MTELNNRDKQKPLVYVAGDIMSRGSQLKREEEKNLLIENGFDVYIPHENKSINDKKNALQEGLAERIVREDLERIDACDIITIEPQTYAQGTLVELGIIYGMKHVAKQINDILENPEVDTLDGIEELANRITSKKVYPHLSDIRRTDIPESGDRRSYSVNQFVYGVALALSEGKGLYEFDEVLEVMNDSKKLDGDK